MINMTPQYNTILFRDVWEYGDEFVLDFKASVFNNEVIASWSGNSILLIS